MKTAPFLTLAALAALCLSACGRGEHSRAERSALCCGSQSQAVERFTDYGSDGATMERLLMGAQQHRSAATEAEQADADKALFLLSRKLRHYLGDWDWGSRVYTDFLATLLDKGANPLAPQGEQGFSCAADYLAAHPLYLKALAGRGHVIEPPAHSFRRETLVGQLLAIPAEAIRTEEAAAHYELLAGLFTCAAEEMPAEDINTGSACGAALRLMQRADTERTVELLLGLPLWRHATAWAQLQEEGALHERARYAQGYQLRCLLLALREAPELILPAEALKPLAEERAAAGDSAAAQLLVRLLGRDPQAAALLEGWCADEQAPLALRAAAWSVTLHRAGLPCLPHAGIYGRERQGIAHWVYGKYRSNGQLVDAIESAILAEKCGSGIHTAYSPYALFELGASFLHEDAQEVALRGKALRCIGAPTAAARYEEIYHADEARRAELRADRKAATAASLELELAVAQHISKHREAFLTQPWKEEEPAEGRGGRR